MSEPISSSAEQAERALIANVAARLYADGETTEGLARAIGELAAAFGQAVSLHARWDQILLTWTQPANAVTTIPATPLGVHMGRVAAAVALVEQIRSEPLSLEAASAAFERVAQIPAASTARFAVMAAAGAAALGVIFGVDRLAVYALIVLSAGLGGALRRGLGRLSANPFLQPFAAALLAGLVEAGAARLGVVDANQLAALCPCMVLVPGPHLLNGAIDLIRARIPLGLARLTYAGLVVAAISSGVLLGLTLGGASLPPPPAASPRGSSLTSLRPESRSRPMRPSFPCRGERSRFRSSSACSPIPRIGCW